MKVSTEISTDLPPAVAVVFVFNFPQGSSNQQQGQEAAVQKAGNNKTICIMTIAVLNSHQSNVITNQTTYLNFSGKQINDRGSMTHFAAIKSA